MSDTLELRGGSWEGGESDHLRRRSDSEDSFISLYDTGVETLFKLLACNTLHPKDVSALLAFMYFTNWKTGRCKCSVEAIGKKLGRCRSNLYQSVKRLKQAGLMATVKFEATGERVYLMSPYLLRVGGPKSRGYIKMLYDKAISDKPELNTLKLEADTLDLEP